MRRSSDSGSIWVTVRGIRILVPPAPYNRIESVGLWYPRGAFQTARAEISKIEKLLAQVVFGITNLTGVDISDFGTPLPPKASVLATRTVVS
jgi:hypothetical protein